MIGWISHRWPEAEHAGFAAFDAGCQGEGWERAVFEVEIDGGVIGEAVIEGFVLIVVGVVFDFDAPMLEWGLPFDPAKEGGFGSGEIGIGVERADAGTAGD